MRGDLQSVPVGEAGSGGVVEGSRAVAGGLGFSSLCVFGSAGCADNVQTTEAYYFEKELAEIARALQVRYPI